MNSITFGEQVSIPTPFRFNPWKHHLRWVQDYLQRIFDNPDDLILKEEVIENIESINSNYVDIYTGELNPEQIIRCIEDDLLKSGITERNKFLLWISQNKFRMILLPDSSVWVLREGNDDESYIHIHPSRNSPGAVRIHGNSWKTVLITKVLFPELNDLDLKITNKVRKELLNLSPIKDLTGSQRLLKAMQHLENKTQT